MHRETASPAERRTTLVTWVTLVVMATEIVVGHLTGSLALLADGWHMATHAAALGFAVIAYRIARKHAHLEERIYALAGYTSAISLLAIAAWMLISCIARFLHPVDVRYDEALPIAILGLVVNLGCAWILRPKACAPADHDHNVRAAYAHLLADTLTSVLAIAAIVGGKYLHLAILDPLSALIGSIIIGKWAIGIARQTGKSLLGA